MDESANQFVIRAVLVDMNARRGIDAHYGSAVRVDAALALITT